MRNSLDTQLFRQNFVLNLNLRQFKVNLDYKGDIMKQSIKYVYDEKGRRYGCVVGLKQVFGPDDNRIVIGVSRCKLSEEKFNRKKALELAKDRAIKWALKETKYEIPYFYIQHYLANFKYNGVNNLKKFEDAIEFVTFMLDKKPKEQNATQSNGTT